MQHKAALWWIKGSEPEYLDEVESPEEQITRWKNRKRTIEDDNDKWFREINKTRQQKRMEILRKSNNQHIPIPSYAEFFKRQEGRN